MKKNNPLISVIVNCHNGEKFLASSIKSILKQSYKNFEVIFCDNQSTDKSVAIVRKFKDKRIKIFKTKKLMKLYEARNFAIKKAKGDFISFLDVDDMWVANKLKDQVNLFNKDGKLVLVYSNCYILRNKSKKKFVNQILPSGKIAQKLLDHYKMPILTVMIKKSFFKERLFNKNYEIIGDFDLFVDLSINNLVGCIQEPLALYRIHDNNLSKKKIDLFINELESWTVRKKKLKIMKKYSFKGVLLQLQLLKIKKYIANNLKYEALKEIIKYPMSFKKLRYISFFVLTKKSINKILSF